MHVPVFGMEIRDGVRVSKQGIYPVSLEMHAISILYWNKSTKLALQRTFIIEFQS